MPTIFDPSSSQANVIDGITLGATAFHSFLDPIFSTDNVYFSLGGADTIIDTDANGWLWGSLSSTSNVQLFGNGGHDVLVSFGGNDFLSGGNDEDTLISGLGDDTLFGGNGKDSLWGGGGSDFLNGGDGMDIIVGGGGGTALARDVLWGGDHDFSRDIMIGEVGSFDNFVTDGGSHVNTLAAVDIFWNFTLGEDIITLRSATGSGTTFSDSVGTPFAGTTTNFAATGLSGTVIYDGSGFATSFLAGVNLTTAQLTTANTFQTY